MLANLREILSKTLLNEFTDCFMLLLCNIFVFTLLLSYDCNLDPLENEMIHHKRLLQYSSKNLQQHQPITTTTGHTRPNETCKKTLGGSQMYGVRTCHHFAQPHVFSQHKSSSICSINFVLTQTQEYPAVTSVASAYHGKQC